MGIEPESASNRGVTRGAVALRMATCTRLQALSSSLPMAEAETAECVVVSRAAEPPHGDQSRLLMTTLAELGRIVAVAAVRAARPRRARMAGQEVRRVIARLRSAFRPVALQAHRPDMTRLACARSRVGFRAMALAEFQRVTSRRCASQMSARSTSRPRDWERGDHARWNSDVTCCAALTGVTGGTGRSAALRLFSMLAQEPRHAMRRRHRQ